MRGAFANDLHQGAVEGVFRICAIEPLITIRAADDQIRALELRQLILDCPQREEAQARHLARVQLLALIGEQQPQHLRADDRKQPMQQRLFDASSNTRML